MKKKKKKKKSREMLPSWNRIFQSEGTCNNHLVHMPQHSRSDQKLKNIIKGIDQMPLED